MPAHKFTNGGLLPSSSRNYQRGILHREDNLSHNFFTKTKKMNIKTNTVIFIISKGFKSALIFLNFGLDKVKLDMMSRKFRESMLMVGSKIALISSEYLLKRDNILDSLQLKSKR